MTERANCFHVAIFILFSLCHMTLTLSYYATNKSPCKSSFLLSMRPCRHLQKTHNGDLKANSASFPFCIHGLRLLWTIFIFTVLFLRAHFHLPKIDGYRQRILFFSVSILWQRSLETAIPPEMRTQQEAYKNNTIGSLSPTELVRIIMLRPTVQLEQTANNTGFKATYQVAPLMNLYFCRDQMITTAKGVVLSRMNSPQREAETKVMRFVLKKMGIRPIYKVTGEGRLEGGDYFSAGNLAFIGQGLRTNAEGIRQILEHKVFGVPRVAVVKDAWNNQEEMHLDTYFNIISPKLAVLVDLRMDLPGKPAQRGMKSKVDVYELDGGRYKKKISDRDFQQYLEKDLGYKVIPVTRKDQKLYGINFLTVNSNRIMAIEGSSEAYKQTLKANRVNATWMDFSALTSGYGAAHCTTQVLRREVAR